MSFRPNSRSKALNNEKCLDNVRNAIKSVICRGFQLIVCKQTKTILKKCQRKSKTRIVCLGNWSLSGIHRYRLRYGGSPRSRYLIFKKTISTSIYDLLGIYVQLQSSSHLFVDFDCDNRTVWRIISSRRETQKLQVIMKKSKTQAITHFTRTESKNKQQSQKEKRRRKKNNLNIMHAIYPKALNIKFQSLFHY